MEMFIENQLLTNNQNLLYTVYFYLYYCRYSEKDALPS